MAKSYVIMEAPVDRDDPVLQLIHDMKVERAKEAITRMLRRWAGLIIYAGLRKWRWPLSHTSAAFTPTQAMQDALGEMFDKDQLLMRRDTHFGYWVKLK